MAAYVAASAAATVSGALHRRRIAGITKPLPIAILAGVAARGRHRRSGADNLLLAGVVGFSAAGDRAMLLEEFNGRDRWLAIGASLFAGAQSCYITTMYRRGARPRPRHLVIRSAVLAESSLVLARHRPALLPVLSGYGATLAIMSAMSADVPRPQPSMAIGGALFLASDLTIINRRHLISDPRWRAVAEIWVLASYFAAQWLLVTGLSQPTRRPRAA